MTALKKGDWVVWSRTRRGRMRRVDKIVARVVDVTPAGNLRLVYDRPTRWMVAIVQPSSCELGERP